MFFLFVNRNITDFFNDLAPLHGRHIYKASNIALQNNIISIRVDFCGSQNIENFGPSFLISINSIDTAAILADGSVDYYFFSINGKSPIGIIKGNFYIGGRSWFLVLAPVEYKIRSFFCPHGFSRKSAENEAERIAYIRFP